MKSQQLVFCSQDAVSAPAQKPNDQDVVLIKEETAKEEVTNNAAPDELLLNDDGKREN